jgi:hypothetical protein
MEWWLFHGKASVYEANGRKTTYVACNKWQIGSLGKSALHKQTSYHFSFIHGSRGNKYAHSPSLEGSLVVINDVCLNELSKSDNK